MPSDNPFAEPDDSDRTVIRPVPGGRNAGISRQPSAESWSARGTESRVGAPLPVSGPAEAVRVGTTPLLVAAAPLLQLLSRLRNTLSQPDPSELRERAVHELRRFEQEARGAGVPMEQLRPAHYALCASLDDVVLATPWGSQGAWAARSLTSTFHQEVRSGDRFFDVLDKLKQTPGTFMPVLELMYLCMALGFQGRYRLSPRGPAELDRLREETYAVIVRQRPAPERELSPHWRGVSAPYRPGRPGLPAWVVGAGGLGAVGGLFAWLSLGLNSQSDTIFEQMVRAPPAEMPRIVSIAPVEPSPVSPVLAQPSALDKLRGFLQPEIAAGLVSVVGTEAVPIVRVRNHGMFASGSAEVQARFDSLVERIGTALKDERGRVQVIGYTDNQPIRTVRFPSNFQLSAVRAHAAAEILARTIGDPSRITIEGRAGADAIASNATAQGREENRRIEIVLQREQ